MKATELDIIESSNTSDQPNWSARSQNSSFREDFFNRTPGAIMYAIAFDLDTEKLKKNYPGHSWNNAYGEVRKFLAGRGFSNQQGSLYYGDKTITQVTAMVAVVELSKAFPYLKNSIEDIRILQLMSADDLMPMVIIGNPD